MYFLYFFIFSVFYFTLFCFPSIAEPFYHVKSADAHYSFDIKGDWILDHKGREENIKNGIVELEFIELPNNCQSILHHHSHLPSILIISSTKPVPDLAFHDIPKYYKIDNYYTLFKSLAEIKKSFADKYVGQTVFNDNLDTIKNLKFSFEKPSEVHISHSEAIIARITKRNARAPKHPANLTDLRIDFFGASSSVSIMITVSTNELLDFLPVFKSIYTSFKFDEGYAIHDK